MSGFKSSDPAGAPPQAPLPPDEPLGLTVHSLPSPSAAAGAARRMGRWKLLMVALVCAAPVIASYFMFYVVRPSTGEAAYSQLIVPTVDMPDLQAQPLQGAALPLRQLKDQWLLVVVDSGRCDAACESRLFLQRQLREMTGRERDRIDKLWLVVDDAPIAPALRAALEATPAMHILRVPRDSLAAWLKPAQGQRLEDHLYVVDPMARWMMRAPVQADPAKLKRDIERLLRASNSWDNAGRTEGLATQPPAVAAPGTSAAPVAPAAAAAPAAMPASLPASGR